MGTSLLIPSLLVNCSLSSLAKSPNQCCKLPLKSPEGSVNYPSKALRGVEKSQSGVQWRVAVCACVRSAGRTQWEYGWFEMVWIES